MKRRNCIILTVVIMLVGSLGKALPESQSDHDLFLLDGNTLYVGGNGPGNYSSIQSAITAASLGDTIFVYNGTYYEHVIVNKSLNLAGEDRDTTMIDGDEEGTVVTISADRVNMSGFTVQNGATNGVLVFFTHNNLSGNTIYSNGMYGVHLIFSSNNTIEKNVISSHSQEGVFMEYSYFNSIRNNEMFSNGHCAIVTTNSSYNMIVGNDMHDNRCTVSLWPGSTHNTISGNKMHHHPCCGIGIWSDSDDNIIRHNEIYENQDWGIGLSNTDGNTIEYNLVHDSPDLIILEGSCQNNTIADNIIFSGDHGITLNTCYFNQITGNNISFCTDEGILFQFSNDNRVIWNTISKSNLGCHLAYSSRNIFRENTICVNTIGFLAELISVSNHIYHNVFLQNNQSAKDFSEDIWNETYPDGGNYWSDYIGNDSYQGSGQNIPGSDGIGDTPYQIPGGSNQDHYPLIGYLLVADANGPYEGTPGEPIQFHGSATGGIPPYQYCWDFGDGNTSSIQNPVYTFASAGTFNVTLTVTDNSTTPQTVMDTTTATIIGTPDIVITSIVGGLGVTITMKNKGTAPAKNITWTIMFDHGVLYPWHGTKTGTIERLQVDEEKTISTKVIGWGVLRPIQMTVTIQTLEGTVTEQTPVQVLLFYVIIK